MTAPATDPYVVISADSHAGLPTEAYRAYLEQQVPPAFDEFLADARLSPRGDATSVGANSDFADSWYAEHGEA